MSTELFVAILIIMLSMIVLTSVMRGYNKIPKDHSCFCYGDKDGKSRLDEQPSLRGKMKCICVGPGKKRVYRHIVF